jgi:hypothetical protein
MKGCFQTAWLTERLTNTETVITHLFNRNTYYCFSYLLLTIKINSNAYNMNTRQKYNYHLPSSNYIKKESTLLA